MFAIQLRFVVPVCVIMVMGSASLDTAIAAEPANEPTPKAQATEQQSSGASKPSKPQPATLSSKKQRERKADVFKPTEQISEDFAAPMPVDI
jgi:hypothetical protein